MSELLLKYEIERLRREAEQRKNDDYSLYVELRKAMLNAQARLWMLMRGTS